MIPDQTSVFEATSLTKKFGDTIALNSVTLSLGAHRVIGLIGRNGGGKTTLIRHMMRILCVLGWWVVLLPMLQWLQVKYDLYDFQRTRQQIGGIVFLILVLILSFVFTGFTSLMRVRYPDLMLTYEAPILLVSFILLQWFLLARLKRYYATQDLV